MDVKKVALLIGALVTGYFALTMTRAGSDWMARIRDSIALLADGKALPVGTIIDAESLAFQAWPKELVQNAYYTEGAPEADVQKLLGTVVPTRSCRPARPRHACRPE